MNLRSMLEHFLHRAPANVVVPTNPEHARTLSRADVLLEDPRIKRLLSVREREMKAAFARGGRKLAGR